MAVLETQIHIEAGVPILTLRCVKCRKTLMVSRHGSEFRTDAIDAHGECAAMDQDTPQERQDTYLRTTTVIVGGEKIDIKTALDATYGDLIPPAIVQSGNDAYPPEAWEIRLKDGTPLRLNREIGGPDYVYSEGTVFLNRKAGIGAATTRNSN